MKIIMKRPLLFFAALLLLLPSAAATAAMNSTSINQARLDKIFKMYESYKKQAFPTAPDVTVATLLQWQQQDSLILVDVRSARERRVSMIPNAISQKEFEKNIDRYKPRKIIVYCTIGYRSGKQVVRFRKKGMDAYNLIGGVLAWAHAGQKFSASDGDSLRVHVYGKEWNLAPVNYKTVW